MQIQYYCKECNQTWTMSDNSDYIPLADLDQTKIYKDGVEIFFGWCEDCANTDIGIYSSNWNYHMSLRV
jgi:hypothetical protein